VTHSVGTAHRDGPRQAAVSRKFTLVDAFALIAALAIAFYPIREYVDYIEDRQILGELGRAWTIAWIWNGTHSP
jgi:hypothetical protein